jgi:fructose/tagatose bisphosphate aldolase
MASEYCKKLDSEQAAVDIVSQACDVQDGKVVSIKDAQKLQDEVIYTLQFNASVHTDEQIKKAAIAWINSIADALHIESSSNVDYYDKKSSGDDQFFTVPAINSRMATFHTVRAAAKVAKELAVPHVIFELALSEVGYTGQQKDEYAALVKAAYISLGMKDQKIYLQADHYQLDPKKYAADSEKEMQRIKDAISHALENEIYNIDIDASKFETADPNKTDKENQAENAKLTAELFHFIRTYEKEHKLPVVVSIGGEVGEVGGENTKYPQVNAYLALLHDHATELGTGNEKALSKVSINVGSAHGGVLGADGKPLEVVPIDFTAHHDLYMLGKDPMAEGKHVLAVQHGASTLPKKYFPLFPAMHVAEIHLATGFQNVIWEVLEKHDAELFGKMKTMVHEKFGEKIAAHKTEAIGFMKERKRVTEFVKEDLLLSSATLEIEKELEKEFTTIFHSLFNLLQSKVGIIEEGDRSD